jgi:DNA-binding MarR family transcriptional regulator
MERDLKRKFMQAIFRFRKSGMDLPKMADINMTEFFVMNGLANNIFGKDQSVDLSQIQCHTHVTKAAISQMFTSLAKKGYIIRETDKSNRRRITVTLTQQGKEILALSQQAADKMLEKILLRLGEEKALQLVSLLNELSDISDGIKRECTVDEEQGESLA